MMTRVKRLIDHMDHGGNLVMTICCRLTRPSRNSMRSEGRDRPQEDFSTMKWHNHDE